MIELSQVHKSFGPKQVLRGVDLTLASGKPLRVVVVDTQANSAGGGQACTAGFTGQTPEVFDAGPEQRHTGGR